MIKDVAASGNARISSFAQALNIDKFVSGTAETFSKFSTEGKIAVFGIICII